MASHEKWDFFISDLVGAQEVELDQHKSSGHILDIETALFYTVVTVWVIMLHSI